MLLLHLAACSWSPEILPSPGTWAEPGDAVGHGIVGGAGPGRAPVWAWRTNADGGVVASTSITVEVEGVPRDLVPDPDGYARFEVDTPGMQGVRAGDAVGRVHVQPGWEGLPLRKGWANGAYALEGDLVPGGAGLVAVEGGRVLWIGRQGLVHPVLAPFDPVVGVASGHLDEDGVADVVAWNTDTVFLLRGRPSGGLVDVGRIASTTHAVAGASLGDADGDGIADVVIAWAGGPHAGQLDVWTGDGRLGFSSSPNRYLAVEPRDITVGQAADDRPQEITVLDADGGWSRFYPYLERFSWAGPSLVLELPTSRARVVEDLLGDGGQELLFLGAYAPETEREVVVLDLQGEARILTLPRGPAHLATHDLDADGHGDLVYSTDDGGLVWTHLADRPDAVTTSRLLPTGTTDGGPVGEVGDDLLVAGPVAWMWFAKGTDDDGELVLAKPSLERLGVTTRGGLYGMLSGGLVGMVSVVTDTFRVMRHTGVDMEQVAGIGLDLQGEELLALEACGDTAWVLTDARLLEVDAADPTAPQVVGAVDVAGTALACSEAGAAVLTGDAVRRFASGPTPGETEEAVGVAGIAMAADDVLVCMEPGCSITRGPFGAGSRAVDVIGTSTSAFVDGIPVVGAGRPLVRDVDGDGRDDLTFVSERRVVLHRWTANGFAAPEIWDTGVAVGSPRWADLGADGDWELIGSDPATGRLIGTVRSAVIVDPPGDTGDTGTPPEVPGDTGQGQP